LWRWSRLRVPEPTNMYVKVETHLNHIHDSWLSPTMTSSFSLHIIIFLFRQWVSRHSSPVPDLKTSRGSHRVPSSFMCRDFHGPNTQKNFRETSVLMQRFAVLVITHASRGMEAHRNREEFANDQQISVRGVFNRLWLATETTIHRLLAVKSLSVSSMSCGDSLIMILWIVAVPVAIFLPFHQTLESVSNLLQMSLL
jgi:hypothetical protein